MKRITSTVLLSAGILLSMTGCQKGTSASEFAGKEVNFTAMSGNPATKTVYTGDGTFEKDKNDNDVLIWERIDWKVGDQILVWSDEAKGRNNGENHEAKYAITGITYNEKGSEICKANIDAADAQGLVYGDRETPKEYNFWSIYPAAAGSSANSWKDNKVTFTIPATQEAGALKDNVVEPDMDNAIMLAAVTGTSAMKEVTLPFYPAFTAFEITLKTESETVTLEKMELLSTQVSGTVEATVIADTRENEVDGKKHKIGGSTYEVKSAEDALTFIFPENTVQVTADKTVTFTVFALPVNFTGVKLRFTYLDSTNSETVVTATLTKKSDKSQIIFGACEKHRLTGLVMPDAWLITYGGTDGITLEEWKSDSPQTLIVE